MEREKAKKNRGTYIYWFIAIKKTSAMWNIVYTSSVHEIKRCIIDSSLRLSAACIAQAPDWNYASEKHSREDHHRWWNVRTRSSVPWLVVTSTVRAPVLGRVSFIWNESKLMKRHAAQMSRRVRLLCRCCCWTRNACSAERILQSAGNQGAKSRNRSESRVCETRKSLLATGIINEESYRRMIYGRSPAWGCWLAARAVIYEVNTLHKIQIRHSSRSSVP